MTHARVPSPRAFRGPGLALAAALALVLSIALPAAAGGPIKLAEPSVSARSRMMRRPMCSPPTTIGSNPVPLSSTASSTAEGK